MDNETSDLVHRVPRIGASITGPLETHIHITGDVIIHGDTESLRKRIAELEGEVRKRDKLIRVDDMLLSAYERHSDRLTAERDAARAELAQHDEVLNVIGIGKGPDVQTWTYKGFNYWSPVAAAEAHMRNTARAKAPAPNWRPMPKDGPPRDIGPVYMLHRAGDLMVRVQWSEGPCKWISTGDDTPDDIQRFSHYCPASELDAVLQLPGTEAPAPTVPAPLSTGKAYPLAISKLEICWRQYPPMDILDVATVAGTVIRLTPAELDEIAKREGWTR